MQFQKLLSSDSARFLIGNSKNRHFSHVLDTINPHRTALVMIEFQNEFAADGGKLYPAVKSVMAKNNMLANAAKTVKVAREKGCKIMHAPIVFSPDFKEISKTPYGILANVKGGECFIRGTWAADFEKSMKPDNGDIIVLGKSGLCGFESTNLQFLLGQNQIETVVLGGFLTNCCVESTMRAAYEKGFKVITLTDCTAATSEAEQVCIFVRLICSLFLNILLD
jgi:nicotinamidase-related amidase